MAGISATSESFQPGDRMPELEPAASKEDLEAAIEGHVLASGEHMCTYER